MLRSEPAEKRILLRGELTKQRSSLLSELAEPSREPNELWLARKQASDKELLQVRTPSLPPSFSPLTLPLSLTLTRSQAGAHGRD